MRSNDSRKTARSTGFGTGGQRLRFSDFPILTVSSQMVSSALLMMMIGAWHLITERRCRTSTPARSPSERSSVMQSNWFSRSRFLASSN
jgi:hypothetical protein